MFWWSRMRSSILKKCWIPFWHGFESHNVNDVQWLLNFWICLKTDSRPPRSSKPHSYTFPITSLPTIWSHVPNVCLETTAAIECLLAIPGLHACSILLTLHCSNAPSSLSPACPQLPCNQLPIQLNAAAHEQQSEHYSPPSQNTPTAASQGPGWDNERLTEMHSCWGSWQRRRRRRVSRQNWLWRQWWQ